LNWNEIRKAFFVAIAAGLLALEVAKIVGVHGSRVADIKALALISLTWVGTLALGLWLTKSQLPGDLRRRRSQKPTP
jgi:hypothetical protein